MRWLLEEARDWVFAVVAIGGVLLLPTFGGNWLYALPFLVVFVAAYLWLVFRSRNAERRDG